LVFGDLNNRVRFILRHNLAGKQKGKKMNGLDRYDERTLMYDQAGGRCASCQETVIFSEMELAHKIAKTKSNVRKYGRTVIDHAMNKAVTHRGKCNDAQNIGFNTCAADALAFDINTELRKASGKRF
jgi:hypothetical protein